MSTAAAATPGMSTAAAAAPGMSTAAAATAAATATAATMTTAATATATATATAAATTTTTAAMTTATCRKPYALGNILFIEDVEGRQADVRDFLLTKKSSPRIVVRRLCRRGRSC
ncbi:MAG TPA: hypothetical protein VGJ20_11275 [Xanthobacteraceae bacterium]